MLDLAPEEFLPGENFFLTVLQKLVLWAALISKGQTGGAGRSSPLPAQLAAHCLRVIPHPFDGSPDCDFRDAEPPRPFHHFRAALQMDADDVASCGI
nr:hypothetical protein [uncultured Brevundimonas sp.]